MEGLLFADFRDKVIESFDKLSVLVDDLSRYVEGDQLKNYRNRLALISSLTLEKGGDEKISAYFENLVGLLAEMLSAFLQKEVNPNYVDRVLKALGLSDAEHAPEKLKQTFLEAYAENRIRFEQFRKQRPMHCLVKEINAIYKE